jgi:hypothetical protein
LLELKTGRIKGRHELMASYILATLIAVGDNSVTVYFRRLVDPTFRGLYQANAFDLAIMLPYFLVMAIL